MQKVFAVKNFCMTAAAVVATSANKIFAQEDAPPQGGGIFDGNFLFIMIAMMAIIYFVMIRPEKKRQKERKEKLSALKKGDRIVTIGGVVGTITAVKDTSYLIKTGEGAVVEFIKSAIQGPLAETDGAAQNAGAENK